jgi:hypothetical protein
VQLIFRETDMPATTLTHDALVQKIWETWRRLYPEILATASPAEQMKQARARAQLAEWEMEPLLLENPLLTREEAWGMVASQFLREPPVFG